MAAVHPCRFRWDIFNPFVPWRRLVATFYHKSSTLMVWKLTLEPDNRSISFWNFKFSLHGVKSGEPDGIIVADKVEVEILINGRSMIHQVENGYYFGSRNWHRYEFPAFAHTQPLMRGPHHLVVDVEITFPDRIIENQGNGFVFDAVDLVQLSRDMRLLFDLPPDSDLRLQSSNPVTTYHVHSCIMYARWSNFFAVHHAIDNATVDMNISADLLWVILCYMYTGILDTTGEDWGTPPFMTELFQVIDRYRMHHLYMIFARDTAQQVRTTRKHQIINIGDFRLDDDNGRAINEPKYTWVVNPNTDHEFLFQIGFYLDARTPWFQYSLQSRSPIRMHAQVNLEFRSEIDGVFGGRGPRSVHECDYSIKSNDKVDSGTCHFEGNMDDLNAFISGTRLYKKGTTVRHYVRCILYLSDGTSAIEIRNEEPLGEPGEQETINLLSDHMYELLMRPALTNFEVSCRTEWPFDPHFPHVHFRLHSCIFKGRVPAWRMVLGNIPEGEDFPSSVVLNTRNDAFLPALVYIYTGKVCPIPVPYLDEVDDFAARGGLFRLRRLINQMRMVNP